MKHLLKARLMPPSYNKESPETIQQLFDHIAKRYDFINSMMSLQMHKAWNSKLTSLLAQHKNGRVLLDLCCGTGEIAFSLLGKAPALHKAYLLDFSDKMLEVARYKADKTSRSKKHDIAYLHADAQAIPLDRESVDIASTAYGIRNIKSPLACAKEVMRVLKPEGLWGILELTRPTNPLLRALHTLYLKTFVPTVGRLFASNRDAYSYLSESIKQFTPPQKLAAVLQEAGFGDIKTVSLAGGIATITLATKAVNANNKRT
ncbi:bifunctional demethylmenaquinone methyltransferase/2-methoxy-6-polyprenyl-1,4-benzoquinol methylase UbiE [Simkania negevensis]|uniref:Demethylmenaquinone methyltransferase n=1 Tax=Simkania negevensis TaxID=83561 RepID=A0ABS3AST6_9BACT|nr:bifunctional demethylmenaquinone methyltransferase/2-methoxy-6-polyprenyl-1,4-benzoquinol methylase UbiE [Simkania negevensis]